MDFDCEYMTAFGCPARETAISIDDYFDFCQNRPECDNQVGTIPDEWCKKCMLEWLQKED